MAEDDNGADGQEHQDATHYANDQHPTLQE